MAHYTDSPSQDWQLTPEEVELVGTGYRAPQAHRITRDRAFKEANRATHSVSDLRDTLAHFRETLKPRGDFPIFQQVSAFLDIMFMGHEFNEAHQRRPREREKANRIMDRAAEAAWTGGRRSPTQAERRANREEFRFQTLAEAFHSLLTEYTEALRERDHWEAERLNTLLTTQVEKLGAAGYDSRHFDTLILDTEEGVRRSRSHRVAQVDNDLSNILTEEEFYRIDEWKGVEG